MKIKNIIKRYHFNFVAFYHQINPFSIYRRVEAIKRLQTQDNTNLKLHIGCGPRVLKTWINIDLFYEKPNKYLQFYGERYYPKKDRGNLTDFYPMDVTKSIWPIKNDTVSVIFHEDFFEHLDQKQQIFFLFEALRVMKRGAIHRINTPNLLSSPFIQNNNGQTTFDSSEWDVYYHKGMITPEYIEKLAKKIGYSKVVFGSKNKSTSKLIPLEYRPGSDRPQDGNIFVDLIK